MTRTAMLTCAAYVLAAWPACAVGAEPPPRPPDILLVTIDTLRPDALGWIGGRNTTPNIDAAATAAIRFRTAVSQVPLTLPSHCSIFTALNPPGHGVRINGQPLATGVPTMTEQLRHAGYTTGAFVSAAPLAEKLGLNRGFEHYDDLFLIAGNDERSAAETTRAALSWIEAAQSPWFAWVHYWDPHAPYDPPRAFWRPGTDGAYLGEIEYVDHEIGALLRRLEAIGSTDRLTVITADHGESLGEHGELTHGYFIYDSTVTVPLIFHWQNRLAPAEIRCSPRLIDLAPTVLDLVGLTPLPGVDGRSLVALFGDPSAGCGAAYLETLVPWTSYGWSPLVGMRTAATKVIAAPTPEAYDLRIDPGETTNIASHLAKLTSSASAEALATARSGRGSSLPIDRETAERLAALGYAAPVSPGQEFPRNKGLADPKAMLEVRGWLHEAEAAAVAGDLPAASALFERVLEKSPQNSAARVRFGWLLLAAGDPARALDQVRRVQRTEPSNPEAAVLANRARAAMADGPTSKEAPGIEFGAEDDG